MAFLNLRHVALRGVSATVPKQVEDIGKIYTKWGVTMKLFIPLQE